MKITILCTDPQHPVMPSLQSWRKEMLGRGHEVSVVNDRRELAGGTFLFLVSCSQILDAATRDQYEHVLVLHASDLPRGRGWSPHVWAVVAGAREITVTLLEAAESVDTGRIWLKETFPLEGHELHDEIHARLFAAELELMTRAVEELGRITPVPQEGAPGEYLRKRTPEDSRLDPEKSLAEQFDLLRICDPERYPAYLDFRGCRYRVRLEKDQRS